MEEEEVQEVRFLGPEEHILRSSSQSWSLAGESDLGQGFREGMWQV